MTGHCDKLCELLRCPAARASVASLRARLRNLSAGQLTQLIEYERGHADRADVITMFERRIAKIEAEA